MSSMSISSARASTSKNRPVPLAQRSFMAKRSTKPLSSTAMTLLSCPPMSTTSRTPGHIAAAPRAWQVISVNELSASSTHPPAVARC